MSKTKSDNTIFKNSLLFVILVLSQFKTLIFPAVILFLNIPCSIYIHFG